MKIGILGTRGIPNHYGGFEQFAQYLSTDLVQKGHEVIVYNSSLHPYQKKEYKGVGLIHCKDREDTLGSAGQFVYDLNCILDSRKRDFDLILQLGYTSSSIWNKFLPKNSLIVTNMDGLEWKRSKYNKLTQLFLKVAERWAVDSSDYLVADSIGIQKHLQTRFKKESAYIAYGSDIFSSANNNILGSYQLNPHSYFLLIARMEPENNIEMILDGYVKSNNKQPFIVIGKVDNAFGKYLTEKFQSHSTIRFIGGVYNFDELNNLRYFSSLYFHGHSVGGTNPSLLEAMAASAQIAAHQNLFNASILEEDAHYFANSEDVSQLLSSEKAKDRRDEMISNNLGKIREQFSWKKIINSYEDLFLKLAQNKN